MTAAYGLVAAGVVLGLLFPLANFVLSRLVSIRNPTPIKLETYECGEPPSDDTWKPINIRYYTFALLFVVFDVEAVFLFPWAIVYKGLDWFVFFEMVVFLLILVLGLVYAWRKGALKWS